VVHRDFTPDNLVLQDDIVYLVYFGTANEVVGTATGTLVGKQCYMPPEQIKGKAEPASDVYAMGCTLAFLFNGSDPEPLSQTKLAAASAPLSELIADMTALDHNRRPDIESVRERLLSMGPAQMSIDKFRQAQR
ncbi:MAG: protein kinase domain-containing protein, partial [Terriglobales bacterium]